MPCSELKTREWRFTRCHLTKQTENLTCVKKAITVLKIQHFKVNVQPYKVIILHILKTKREARKETYIAIFFAFILA